MDTNEIREWELAVDEAERNPLTANLPKEFAAGDRFEETGADGVQRRWLAVTVVSGNVAGRWAYWAPWTVDASYPSRAGQGPHPSHFAVADRIFNGDVNHFIGMLANPWVKMPGVQPPSWVLVDPKMSAPPLTYHRAEPVKERYERSKEVFDVETGTSRQLP